MGWKLKGLALVLAIMLFPFAWIVSAALLVYVFSGFIFRRRERPVVVQVNTAPQQAGDPGAGAAQPAQAVAVAQPQGRLSARSSLRYALGGLFLVLGLVAASEGGRLSPFVLGGVGAALLAWGPLSGAAQISALEPVEESTLLRSRIPFVWVALAEVKLATQQPSRPLAGIRERVIVLASGPAMYLVVRRSALTHGRAEERVMARMREMEKAMAPLGAYLLPMDSTRAAEKLTLSLKEVDMGPDQWKQGLSSLHYDVLTMQPKEGYVRSFAAYVKDGRAGSRAKLPRVHGSPSRPPLLWEALYQVGMRVKWSSPDAYTAFLSSMEATEDSAIGERVTDMGTDQDSHMLRVRSVGSPTVELSRPELRAIVRVYTPPVKDGPVQAFLEKVQA